MKSKDVVVGKVYAVKVNGKIAPVRLESMREGYKTRTVHHALRGTYPGLTVKASWDGVNLSTGRKVHVRSAAKLRYELIQLNQTWVPQKTAVAPLPSKAVTQ